MKGIAMYRLLFIALVFVFSAQFPLPAQHDHPTPPPGVLTPLPTTTLPPGVSTPVTNPPRGATPEQWVYLPAIHQKH